MDTEHIGRIGRRLDASRVNMTHYQIPNSVLFGRAQGNNVSKALSDYSRETLQKRADLGNANAKQLIEQLNNKNAVGKQCR